MKLSKNLGRIATTFLATAMLAAFAAVPASAEAVTGGVIGTGNGNPITSFTMPVEIKKPNMVITPDVALTIAVSGASVTDEKIEVGEENQKISLDVHSGTGNITVQPDGGQVGGNVTFSAATDGVGGSDETQGSGTISKNVTFDLNGLNFTDAGVYKYTITTTVSGSTPDEFTKAGDLSLYLFVENNSGYHVTGVVVKNGEAAKTSAITNYYMLDPTDPGDPTQKVADLTIRNSVEGTMGNHDEEFTYTFTIGNGKSYKAVKADKDGGKTALTLATGNTFTLKDSESIVIYGIDKGQNVNIKEDGATMGYEVKVDSAPYSEAGYDVTMDSAKDVTFTNTRNSVAPTGLVMNVAPYVLLVLVAAGAGYVFLRKREED